jgi:hypothetical protein
MGSISRLIRRIKNRIVLRVLIKRAGGNEERDSIRDSRIKSIRGLKESIRRDLMNSWRLKEIREPDPEDQEIIRCDSKTVPISTFNRIKKKYWGGNIYNEF